MDWGFGLADADCYIYRMVSNKALLHSTKKYIQYPCTPMADSCQCMAKTTTIL